MAAAVPPESTLKATSQPREGAIAAPTLPSVQAAVASAITRRLP